MENNINRIAIFYNNNKKSYDLYHKLKKKLLINNYILDQENYDLVIGIGGDGIFLRTIRNLNYKNILYIGFNTGTLGFIQEINNNDINCLIDILVNKRLITRKVNLLDIEIYTEKNYYKYHAINEVAIREQDLNTLKMKIYISKQLMQNFAGDGVLVASSFGSTAYNLSFGGAIVHNDLNTIQLTPIAPINNNSYRNLQNSYILPSNQKIILKHKNNNLLITLDGENINVSKVKNIKISLSTKYIKVIKNINNNFTKKINEKFLK